MVSVSIFIRDSNKQIWIWDAIGERHLPDYPASNVKFGAKGIMGYLLQIYFMLYIIAGDPFNKGF